MWAAIKKSWIGCGPRPSRWAHWPTEIPFSILNSKPDFLGECMFGRLLARLARELESLGFPYMVIGGQAVLIHGEPRFTRDIDVTLGTSPDSLPRLLAAINTIGWKALP